jgi:PAS domain S-box-containing protein
MADNLPDAVPGDTADRLAALARYRILDTPREESFDDIAALAAQICETPIAVVNLIDKERQWFKAEVGLGIDGTPLETSFCVHALLEDDFLLVPDATKDARFACNPLVTGEPGLRFYAGALLRTTEGHAIGTLCVLDVVPRTLDDDQQTALRRLARQVMAQLELRLALAERERINVELERGARFRELSRTWDVTPDIMGVLNDNGIFERSNPAWQQVLGLSEETVSTTPIFELMHPDDIARALDAFATVKRGDPVLRFENRYRHGVDGSYRWLSWVVVPEGGKYYASAREITADKVRADALETAVAERQDAWNASPDLLAVADFQGVLREVNPAWTAVLGWQSIDLVDHPFAELTHPDDLDEALDVFAGVIKAPLVDPFEFRLRDHDGDYRWFAWTAAARDGRVYASGRDVTQRREQAAMLLETEEALRQSQKLEAIGQLTGGVAHDFNNLLTVIRGSVDMLRRGEISDERRTRYIEAISTTVDRATRLTGQLLAFARRQALKPEAFDVGRNMTGLREMVSTLTGSRIKIDVDLDEAPCCVRADPSQFDTAIVNLAVNARDAMAGEGALSIAVRRVDHVPAIRAHARIDGDFVSISVADSGTGIAREQLDQIFEPFFTTKDVGQGTGLGLSQVFGFVKQSGGEVDVRSEVGHGSCFTIYLPRIDHSECVRAPHGAGAHETGPAGGDGKCVLVVEDNAEVGDFAVQALAELGYDVVLVDNASRALDLLETRPDRFDVVFSDVMMAGMTGIELAREIRREFPAVPVVLASGYSSVIAQEGHDGFDLLAKPYSIEELSFALSKAAAGPSSE